MRLAEDGDYVAPVLPPDELEELEKTTPDVLRVLAFAGTKETPQQFWTEEKSLSKQAYPLAMMKAQPFQNIFGPTWGLASGQNKTKAPGARLPLNVDAAEIL